jgi:hypothetical protein
MLVHTHPSTSSGHALVRLLHNMPPKKDKKKKKGTGKKGKKKGALSSNEKFLQLR